MKSIEYSKLVETLDTLIETYLKNSRPEDREIKLINIYMPKYLIDVFTKLTFKGEFNPRDKFKPLTEYKGYRLLTGYEDKLVIAHERYTMDQLPYYYSDMEIPLQAQ